MKIRVLRSIRCALPVMAFVALCSFADECYDAWISAFGAATAEYNADVIHCLTNPLFGIPASSVLCLWEADVNYSNAVNQAGADYEYCIANRD